MGMWTDKKYNNIELWEMAESGNLPKGTIIEDSEGNQSIFTGKSFQVYYSKIENMYVGLCKGDEWEIVDIDEDELL